MGAPRNVPSRIAALDDLFADNFHGLRVEKKLSRREMAELTGIPERTLMRIETGQGTRGERRRRVSIGEALTLAEALDVKPGDLLKGATR